MQSVEGLHQYYEAVISTSVLEELRHTYSNAKAKSETGGRGVVEVCSER